MQLSSIVRAARCAFAALGLAMPLLASAQFIKGADVSWVSEEEASGKSFYNSSGVKTDPFVLLKGKGVNAIRLRVWVNPTYGWSNGADVLYKAKRAQAQGQQLMIDFHYSDTWADPSHQTKPAAWTNHSFTQLQSDVYSHTYNTLNYLKSNGITSVAWVQVGNEVSQGMLWPDGYVSGTQGFDKLAQLINQGYNAAKAVYPSTKVILHLNNGYDNGMFRWWFDNVKANGAHWDVTGMSHYPSSTTWQTDNSHVSTNMSDMVARYGKPVMVCEVGMDWNQPSTTSSMLSDLIAKIKALGANGLGVFYWEPEAYPGWGNYTMGALNKQGQFTSALNPFLSN